MMGVSPSQLYQICDSTANGDAKQNLVLSHPKSTVAKGRQVALQPVELATMLGLHLMY